MFYRGLFEGLLRWLPPGFTHALASRLLRAVTAPAPVRRLLRARAFGWRRGSSPIAVSALGLEFPSPIGAAAGLDKNADWFEALGALGFGFVEVGTITPAAQGPNAAPTITRVLGDRALLNRMGFPNAGADTAAARLERRRRAPVVGANIGKQRTTALADAARDYREVARRVAPYADYVVINVSSPNTPGLRELGTPDNLEALIAAVREGLAGAPSAVHGPGLVSGDVAAVPVPPLLVKISPDLSDQEIDAVADLALRLGLDGIIATNTTVNRDTITLTPVSTLRWFTGGGVSGAPLKARSLAVLQRLHARTQGRVVLISVGGIESVDDVWERIAHGASLVQAYTGFIYGGPAWPGAINRGLARRVRRAGLQSIGQLIGSAAAGSPAAGSPAAGETGLAGPGAPAPAPGDF